MNKFDIFNSNHLRFARKRRGFTIAALASLLEITPRTLSNYENGHGEPKGSLVPKISRSLNFPVDFFYREDVPSIETNTVSFRSLSRMSASVKDAALSAGQIALEFSMWLDKRFELPETDLPDLSNHEPETAAETLRSEWTMGQHPVGNMIHLLEAKGVRVFSLVEKTLDMDAFSFWMDDHPYVFLNTRKSVERSRFDAAHELGHILLHKHGATPMGKEAESQANRFASAFLMPQGSVIAKASNVSSINSIITVKSYWKVAASALIRRMKDLCLLTEWNYRSFIIELSKRGYLKDEPNPLLCRETSKILPMIFQSLRKEGIKKEDIAREIGVFVDDIDALIFNLSFIGLHGGAKETRLSHGPDKKNQYLRLVK